MNIQILIQILILTSVFSLKVSDFQPSLFKFSSIQQGFRNIDTGSTSLGQVIAFCDLDGDRFTDYVAIQNKNTQNLFFYFWNQQKQQFIEYTRKIETLSNINIQQIIVYDLNQDGYNQIIITTNQGNNQYKLTIYQIGCIKCIDTLKKIKGSQIINLNAVPFLIDNQGTGIVKIFAVVNNNRMLYSYDFNSNIYKITQFSKIVDNFAQVSPFKNISKHFASTIDLNNDCKADLALISYSVIQNITIYYLQVFLKKNNNHYSLQRIFSLQNDFSNRIVSVTEQQNQINKNKNINKVEAVKIIEIQNIVSMTLANLDNSGAMDFVFLYKQNNKMNFKSLLNNITPKGICIPHQNGIFPFHDFDFGNLPDIQIPLHYNLTEKSKPHFNDINADGLSDILIIMKDINGYQKVNILINTGNFKFIRYDDQWRAYDLNNPHQVLFYDYADDGKMDLMIISEEKKQNDGEFTYSYTRTTVMNNLHSDTLHLKILPLSITSNYNEDQQKVSSSFGVTIQWLFTDIDGNKLVQIANQKFQFNYGSLQLPYSYSGLGRTNNYVEQLTVSYQNSQKQDWTPVIPNSQLMVYKQKGDWKLQTLLRNNQRVNDVIYVAILILFLMGIVIFYLNYKEAQEDKRDHYSFIQLIR